MSGDDDDPGYESGPYCKHWGSPGECDECDAEARAPFVAEIDRLKAQRDDLLAAMESTASMLSYEATCHEQSGDAKRRSCVDPIRAQVALARTAIAKARGE